jgi:Cu/Ag efflux protein CusF
MRKLGPMTRRKAVWAMPAFAALCACGEKQAPAKRYPMQGEVKAIDASAKTASIAAGQIGDWMAAMTMEYPVKPEAEFQKLHVGDKIEATVVVQDLSFYVTDVKVVGK